MKLLKTLIAFAILVALQIVAAQWLNVPPPVEARTLMVVGGGVSVAVGGGYIGSDESLLNENSGGGDGARCLKFTTTTPGTINTLHLYLGSWNTGQDALYAGIYSHDAGNDWPNAQLAYGSKTSGITLSAKNAVTMVSGYSISSSTVYWLCFSAKATGSFIELYHGTSSNTGGRELRIASSECTQNSLPTDANANYTAAATYIGIAYGD